MDQSRIPDDCGSHPQTQIMLWFAIFYFSLVYVHIHKKYTRPGQLNLEDNRSYFQLGLLARSSFQRNLLDSSQKENIIEALTQ